MSEIAKQKIDHVEQLKNQYSVDVKERIHNMYILLGRINREKNSHTRNDKKINAFERKICEIHDDIMSDFKQEDKIEFESGDKA